MRVEAALWRALAERVRRDREALKPCVICGQRTRNRVTLAAPYGMTPDPICETHVMRVVDLRAERRV